MKRISKEKLKNVYAYYLKNGLEKTATDLKLTQSSVERYIREVKPMQKDLLSENKLWQELNKKFTIEELKSIAKNEVTLKKSKATLLNLEGDIFKIGVLSDLHIGSNFFHPQKLLTALDMFVNEKVDFVVICGDVVEGMALRDGHIYELTHFGYEQQKNYAVELLSKYKLKYYMIDGNHDRWYLKNANQGALIVKDICNSLENSEFIGHDEGDIFLNGAKIKLWHGEDGNSSYAVSYRVQKIIEAFQGGEKPNVLICGHTHKYLKLFLRNIHAFSAGCIQMQSSWMRRKKLEAHPCFLILTLRIADSEVKYLKEEMIPFYC